MTHIARLFKDLIHRVCSPSPVGIPAYLRIIRNPTVKVLDFVQLGGPTLGKPSHQRQDGRSFRGDPRAPIPSPDVRRGTGCSGHSPGGTQTLPDPQEQVPGTGPSRHVRSTLSIGPKAPGGVPGGLRRRGPISPSLTTARPDASPAQTPTAPGLRTKALEADPRLSPHSSRPHPQRIISMGARSLSPISARSFPAHRVSAPCSPPDQRTRIPRRLVSKSK